MKKAGFILFSTLLILTELQAQPGIADPQKGKSQAVSLGISLPAGVFSESHFAGLSSNYSWSHQRFGKLTVLPKKIIGFTANGGIDYYFGKKIETAGYDFRYGGYLYLHAFGGLICNPGKKMNATLTGGPALGIYKGNADAGFGVMLNGSSYITDKIAITPGIMYMKHDKTNALWVVSLRATCLF